MVICEDYEISQTTIALLHNHHEKYQTKILDLEGEFQTNYETIGGSLFKQLFHL
jgi:hypothetical protein